MECGYGQMWTSECYTCKQIPAKVMIPVQINGIEVMGLMDFGYGQSPVWDNLVSLGASEFGTIFLQCIHRDLKPSLSAQAQLTAGENAKSLVVRLTLTSAYPIILGWDWEYYLKVLKGIKPTPETLKGVAKRTLGDRSPKPMMLGGVGEKLDPGERESG